MSQGQDMTVVVAQPPCWENLIKAGFTADELRDCIFTWGDIIYNPDNVPVGPELRAHESRHRDQQAALNDEANGVDGRDEWWRRWILDPAFRAEQEAQGYGAQYSTWCGYHKDRNERARYMHRIAGILASGTYKVSMSIADARAAILKRSQ